jgi:hypothetical protein
MNDISRTSPAAWRSCASAASLATILFCLAMPAEAAPHRARLSNDLADRVAKGVSATSSVIVSGTDA